MHELIGAAHFTVRPSGDLVVHVLQCKEVGGEEDVGCAEFDQVVIEIVYATFDVL